MAKKIKSTGQILDVSKLFPSLPTAADLKAETEKELVIQETVREILNTPAQTDSGPVQNMTPRATDYIEHEETDTTIGTDKDIDLDKWQRAAIAMLAGQKYGCLVGPAGSGKTTCLHNLLDTLLVASEHTDIHSGAVSYRIAIAAFTGRASQQTKKGLAPEWHSRCDTIHGLLEFKPVFEPYLDPVTKEWKERRVFRPQRTAENKLDLKVLIIDEAGMLPVTLWNQVVDALPNDCRVLFIGDIQQLKPPIGRSTLGFAMNKWPTAGLEKIHRTDEDAIIGTAHKILNGQKPVSKNGSVLVKALHQSGDIAFKQVLSGVKDLHKKGQFSPETDAIVVAYNQGVLGQEILNAHLVNVFNPPKYIDGLRINPRHFIRAGIHTVNFAEGDKVMLTSNIRELGLTNGQWGFVTRIWENPQYRGNPDVADTFKALSNESVSFEGLELADTQNTEETAERQASHCMEVEFKTATATAYVTFATAGDFGSVQLAYVCTCHKMQGSEARRVIVVCHSAQTRLLSREWLYTAATRAQEQLYILHNGKGLNKALRTQAIKGDTIEEKCKTFQQLLLSDAEDTAAENIPTIMEPEAIDGYVPTESFVNNPYIVPKEEKAGPQHSALWEKLGLAAGD